MGDCMGDCRAVRRDVRRDVRRGIRRAVRRDFRGDVRRDDALVFTYYEVNCPLRWPTHYYVTCHVHIAKLKEIT